MSAILDDDGSSRDSAATTTTTTRTKRFKFSARVHDDSDAMDSDDAGSDIDPSVCFHS